MRRAQRNELRGATSRSAGRSRGGSAMRPLQCRVRGSRCLGDAAMRAIRFLLCRALLCALAVWTASAVAQTVPPDLALEVITDQIQAPIGVRAPHDGSGRLFVISQAGTISVIKNGTLLPTPFLTVSVTYPGTGGTSGLLGLAFHPNYGQAELAPQRRVLHRLHARRKLQRARQLPWQRTGRSDGALHGVGRIRMSRIRPARW